MNCVDDKRHYEVLSPEMSAVQPVTDDGEGPIEFWVEWVCVLATDRRDALKQAIKHTDFQPWVKEARRDQINPFSGVKARLTLCKHGVCWACNDELMPCDVCLSSDNEPF